MQLCGGDTAGVYIAGVLAYMATEIVSLTGNRAKAVMVISIFASPTDP